MSWEKIVKTTNTQLDKAKDFRYFALLATFVFFLDYCLIVFMGVSLLEWLMGEQIKGGFQFGRALLFFAIFGFFLSFIVPFVQQFLIVIAVMVPVKWYGPFANDGWSNIKPKDYIYIDSLERYSVRNNSSVIFDYCKQKKDANNENEQLNYFCLSFLITTMLEVLAYLDNENALMSALPKLFDYSRASYFGGLVLVFVVFLYCYCFYRGVIKGGRFSFEDTNRVFFPNHEFKY